MKRFFIFVFIFTSCVIQQPRVPTDSTSLESRSERRGSSGFKSSSSSRNSGGECADSNRCEDICEDLFEYSKEIRECLKLSLSEVGKIQEVFDVLTEPTASRLNRLADSLFIEFVEHGLSSWIRIIRGTYKDALLRDDDDDISPGYTRSEALATLDFIADHSKVAEAIDESDDTENIVFDLYDRIGRDQTPSNKWDPDDDDEGTLVSLNYDDVRIAFRLNVGFAVHGYLLNSAPDSSNDFPSLVLNSELGERGETGGLNLLHNFLDYVCEESSVLEGGTFVNIPTSSTSNGALLGGSSVGGVDDRKVCLSAMYFCEGVDPTRNGGFDDGDAYGALRFLLAGSRRRSAQDAVYCNNWSTSSTTFTDFRDWNDYWRN